MICQPLPYSGDSVGTPGHLLRNGSSSGLPALRTDNSPAFVQARRAPVDVDALCDQIQAQMTELMRLARTLEASRKIFGR